MYSINMREGLSYSLLANSARPLCWVRQAARRPYRSKAKPTAEGTDWDGMTLGRVEQEPNYQRMVGRLVRASARFQRGLTAEQRRSWLRLEDALLDHAWYLHRYYFKAGYQLGKSTARRARRAGDELREQAVLVSALARFLDELMDD